MLPEQQIQYLTRIIKECDEGIAAFEKLRKEADGKPIADSPELSKAIVVYRSYPYIQEALKIKLINRKKFKHYLIAFLAMYRLDSKYKRDRYRGLFRDLRKDLKEIEEKQSQITL